LALVVDVKLICPQCSVEFDRNTGHVNRSLKIGAPLYCGLACAGLARRLKVPKTDEQKRAEKSEYDRKRREEHGIDLRAKKMAAYYADHERNLARAKEYRKIRMPKHVEYCRRPEYRAYKHEYDIKRNSQEYADFAEAWRLLIELEKEIRSQASAYERRVANGYYLRSAQKRRRELWARKSTT
jgi:hypothetical protein